MEPKPVKASQTEMTQLMMPHHANPAGMVYGGTILSIADSVAYVCAARHAGPSCVTVSVDRVDFHEAIHIGEVVTFLASVNFAGRSSMEIGIKILTENLHTAKRRHTNSCYFTMVCVDSKGRPAQVPPLTAETPEEKRRMKNAEARRKIRAAEREKKEI